jgi:hypothetical protein
MPRINLNEIQIGSKIIHQGNILTVTSITDKHTYKGAFFAKTAVCSCSIKTERGTQVTAFVPFILCPDNSYKSSEEYMPKKDKQIMTCNSCNKIFVAEIFCIHCGSANIKPIDNNLPFP